MRKTTILDPFENINKKDKKIYLDNYARIKYYLNKCFANKSFLNYDEILRNLNMTELEYINAIRATLTSSRVFLKRTINEINLNAYNDDILTLHQGNMDIQFILNP
jgi:hypothetical protein